MMGRDDVHEDEGGKRKAIADRLIDQARRHLSAISPDARFPFDNIGREQQ